MSRETDSSSSGPQGRGGAAYPSGTPPYGSRQYPSLHPTQDAPDEADRAAEPPSDEPRTETTLTTRIRINIPGSRPIPPVVMRTPMSDVDASARASAAAAEAAEKESERTGNTPRPDPANDSAAAPAPQAEEKTSDWFAPRKSAPPAAPSSPAPPASSPSGGAAPSGANGGSGAGPRPGGSGGPGTGLPYFSDAAPSGTAPGGSLSDLAANADSSPSGGSNGFAPGSGTPPLGVRTPAGPTGGPVKGSMPIRPRPGGSQGAPGSPGAPRPGGPAVPGPGAPGAAGPGGPPRMSDDTAVLTPQKPGPGGSPPAGPGGNVSGDTLTSGIPVVPGDHRSSFPPHGGPAGPGTGPNPLAPPIAVPQDAGEFSAPEFPAGPGGGPAGPVVPTPSPDAAPRPAPARSAPAKKGRSKLVLAGVGGVVVLGIAYGAGLLMNHSDVPKSTTVLGVDIGGGTKEQAVNKLDAALGKRAASPLQLSVGGKKAQLAPDKAGLSLDSQTTVRNAAGSDYNPVSVIGSLFGGERVEEPVILVDEEKLSVALTDLAGTSGSATEGTIRFEPDKVVPVPGKAGQALDVGRSMISIKDAYRAQVETGRPNLVELPVASRQPTVTQAEIDRAMKDFAEPAMSGLITIKAGGKQIQFGPARSLPKILSMKAIDGKLVEFYDKKAIEELLDGVFDGVLITKGDGKKHQLTADDVAQAMRTALRGKTPADRTAEIELDPS